MTIRPATHRASGQARREALLAAAVEIVAERGVRGATHRAIAERAELPPSTTSYFFASIDELVLEALRTFAQRRIEELEALSFADKASDIAGKTPIDAVAELLATTSRIEQIAQLEAYLEAARRPEAAEEVHAVMEAFRALTVSALHAAHIAEADRAAPAFQAMADGFMLHRVARPRGEEDTRALRDGFAALLRGFGG